MYKKTKRLKFPLGQMIFSQLIEVLLDKEKETINFIKKKINNNFKI